jgi:transposase
MDRLFWLSDEQWAAIEPQLPKNQPGARRKDDRRVISGILHVLKIGCRWQDCPAAYGPATTIYNRFNRWSRRRFWTALLEALAGTGALTKSTAVDSTYVKAQRSAFGGKGGRGGRRSAPRAAARPPRSMPLPTRSAAPTRSRSRPATSAT